MMQYAIIEGDKVVNVAVWDGKTEWEPDEGLKVINIADISPQPGIGWTFDGTNFIAPPQPEKSKEELVIEAENQKQISINYANDYINSKQWPGKAAIGRLKDAELEQYNLWLDYLDALEAIDTTKAPNVIWPVNPDN